MQRFDLGRYRAQSDDDASHGVRRPSDRDGRQGRSSTVAPRHIDWSRLDGRGRALAGAILLLLGLVLLQTTGARAQGAGILAPGDAVVTGFSGIKAPDAPVPPGGDPLDAFHIDLDGPSAQILQLGVPGVPPQGQPISVPAPYKARAREVGQVFAIALDDSPVPNVYVGQTPAFGLHIVGPDGDGDGRPDRLRKGGPAAQWMPGQFGTGGGPGSVYKIDGRTGIVSVFATIPGNGGAGLGDIVFDKASRQFFASDLDNGQIRRLDISGTLIDSFDHGTAGRPAAGLPPVADDGAKANIKDAGFSVEDPGTWGFTPKPRLVWGMAVHEGRLYYAVAEGPAIWSIGIAADGGFAGDARKEFQVADTPAGHAVSDIAFDSEGRMYLAQRGEIRGSYDYSTFAEPEQSVVRRYKREPAQDPAAPAVWLAAPEEYAIGFPAGHRNTAGGIALGYAYDETGSIRRGTCGGTLWSTGDNLRNDEKHAAKLGDEGPLDVHGLQGNAVGLVRPQNEPPFQSYFVDYDSQFGDPGKAGHVGDVEIWQPCEGSPGFTDLYPGYPPPGYVWPGDWPPPGIPPPPPGDKPTNLKLDQKAVGCWHIGGGKHRCGFLVTVANAGPGVYHDHIQLRDRIPDLPGVTAKFTGAKFNACPGGAPKYTCSTLAPAHLLPWEKVVLPVRVDVPDKLAKQLGCKVKNRARILHAPSPSDQNTDPGDDAEAATALLPAHLCQDPPQAKSNLRITNQAGKCLWLGGKFKCGFDVRVFNWGPDTYKGKIRVTDSVPGGTTAKFGGGWNCPAPGQGPSYACKHAPVVFAPSLLANVPLKVWVDVPAQRAKQLGCKVTNTAKIDFAPSPSDKNTNPADDKASATAVIPPVLCNLLGKTNLRLGVGLDFQAPCPLVGNATWCKRFPVLIKNTGPGTFEGKIKVLDIAPPGLNVGFAPKANWTCNAATRRCRTIGKIELPKNDSTYAFNVHLSGDDKDAKALNCKLKNLARILSPKGAPKNVNPADDSDHKTYDLPAELCDGPKGKANLKISVKTDTCGKLAGSEDVRYCHFRIKVWNAGPGDYKGKIEINNKLPAETSAAVYGKVGNWTCKSGEPYTCITSNAVVLKPTDALALEVNMNLTLTRAKELGCRVRNRAWITRAPGGSPKNTDKADDEDAAWGVIPPELCSETSDVKPCPPGFRRVGGRCEPEIVTPPPPPPGCPSGTVGRYPDCRPVVDPPTRVCPAGTVGKWPNCRRRECPRGMVGEWPNCRRQVCPAGTIGKWPNCRKRECPRGMVGTWPNCRRVDPPRCPPGMIGRPPNCRPRPCPPGRVRIRGRCIKPAG
jgi:hypothetical protein